MVGEHELMCRYQRGDTTEFEALYRRHRAPLYRFLLRQFAREAVEDLFQDTWLRVIKAQQRYRPTGPFAAYLYRIARHALIDHFRRPECAPAATWLSCIRRLQETQSADVTPELEAFKERCPTVDLPPEFALDAP